jgi:hypothetical protein
MLIFGAKRDPAKKRDSDSLGEDLSSKESAPTFRGYVSPGPSVPLSAATRQVPGNVVQLASHLYYSPQQVEHLYALSLII